MNLITLLFLHSLFSSFTILLAWWALNRPTKAITSRKRQKKEKLVIIHAAGTKWLLNRENKKIVWLGADKYNKLGWKKVKK